MDFALIGPIAGYLATLLASSALEGVLLPMRMVAYQNASEGMGDSIMRAYLRWRMLGRLAFVAGSVSFAFQIADFFPDDKGVVIVGLTVEAVAINGLVTIWESRY